MIILESQKLALDLTVRYAVGDHAGLDQAWKDADPGRRRQAGLYLAHMADAVRKIAAAEAGEAVPFPVSVIPASLCPPARGYAVACHLGGPAGLAAAWPRCDCQLDLAVVFAELYLRQGEALGFTRGDQASLTARMLAAAAPAVVTDSWDDSAWHDRAARPGS